MRWRRLAYRLPLTGVAVAGAVVGHMVAYLLAVPEPTARVALLGATGHAYWTAAIAAAVVLGLASVATTLLRQFRAGLLRSRPQAGQSVGRLAAQPRLLRHPQQRRSHQAQPHPPAPSARLPGHPRARRSLAPAATPLGPGSAALRRVLPPAHAPSIFGSAADRPPGTGLCCPCRSGRVGRPAGALLSGQVMAGGMTGGMTAARSLGGRVPGGRLRSRRP
jgi:hypothetical protein